VGMTGQEKDGTNERKKKNRKSGDSTCQIE